MTMNETLQAKIEAVLETATYGDDVSEIAQRITGVVQAHFHAAIYDGSNAADFKKLMTEARDDKPSQKAKPKSSPSKVQTWDAQSRGRVPNWVLEQTGLKTKDEIVAKFGDKAIFEMGKPSPKK